MTAEELKAEIAIEFVALRQVVGHQSEEEKGSWRKGVNSLPWFDSVSEE